MALPTIVALVSAGLRPFHRVLPASVCACRTGACFPWLVPGSSVRERSPRDSDARARARRHRRHRGDAAPLAILAPIADLGSRPGERAPAAVDARAARSWHGGA